MCLSKVFQIVGGEEKQICEYISEVRLVDGRVVLTDIMGQETVVPGHVRSVDLVKNKITIEA